MNERQRKALCRVKAALASDLPLERLSDVFYDAKDVGIDHGYDCDDLAAALAEALAVGLSVPDPATPEERT